jgi:hypothetical protein
VQLKRTETPGEGARSFPPPRPACESVDALGLPSRAGHCVSTSSRRRVLMSASESGRGLPLQHMTNQKAATYREPNVMPFTSRLSPVYSLYICPFCPSLTAVRVTLVCAVGMLYPSRFLDALVAALHLLMWIRPMGLLQPVTSHSGALQQSLAACVTLPAVGLFQQG